MSVKNLIGDLLEGNFSHALKRVEDFFQNLPDDVTAFLQRLSTDGGKLLTQLAEEAVSDIVTAGFTTESFVKAAKDIVAKGLEQGKTILIQDAFVKLNTLAVPLLPEKVALAEQEPTGDLPQPSASV